MCTLLTRWLAHSLATLAFILFTTVVCLAQSTDGHSSHWSGESGTLPGVKGSYHIITDPNRRDDRIGSSDDGGAKLGNWKVRTWGDVSFGIGASSGGQKSGH